VISTLEDLLRLLDLQQTDDATFVGTQPDTPNHHIIGSQVAAQALVLQAERRPAGWRTACTCTSCGVVTQDSRSGMR